MKSKCPTCGELKTLTNFYKKKNKKSHEAECKICWNLTTARSHKKLYNTEIGFLQMRYSGIKNRERTRQDRRHQCHFTFKEFQEAFEKHKKKHGRNSAWGPHHLPMTMIFKGEGKKGMLGSNLSCDRLDTSKPYTIQNLIFIRTDENMRKKDTTYEDCIAQIELHKERFIDMRSI